MLYVGLRRLPAAERPRAVRNLVALREQLSAEIPPKDADDHLLLATWNVRDLAKVNRRGFGNRLRESHFYIAEVLSRFDFVAVQEVNELDEWDRIMDILGSHWAYVATDVSDPAAGGNGERLTYLYDTRKVRFQNIAGEIVLPASMLITENVEAPADDPDATVEVQATSVGRQFARTPFTALFQAGWFRFDVCTVHIYFGDESGAKLRRRIKEIEAIAKYFARRAESDFKDQRSLILLGDFNVVHPEHATMQALKKAKFQVPPGLENAPTNLDRTKFYDQIVYQLHPGAPEYFARDRDDATPDCGVFPIFDRVFTEEQFDDYRDDAAASPNGDRADDLRDYYLDWRTYQFSDHLPMWVRLRVNDSADYLTRINGRR